MRKAIHTHGNRVTMDVEVFENLCKAICESALENAELRDELERTRDLLEFAECEADHYKDTARRMEKYENFYYAVKYGVDLTENGFDELTIRDGIEGTLEASLDLDLDEDEVEFEYVSNGIVFDGIHNENV